MIFLPAAVYAAVLVSQPFTMPRYAVEPPPSPACNWQLGPGLCGMFTPSYQSQILPMRYGHDD
jgi:hypothetical protein